MAGVALVVTVIVAQGFWHSGVIARHFRPEAPDVKMLRAGDALRRAAGDKAVMVVVDDYGVNSPMLLYFAHAKGWSFDAATVSGPPPSSHAWPSCRAWAAFWVPASAVH